MNKILLTVILILIAVGGYALVAYNGFVSANEGINGQWAQVETQYQRRFDLIPNLVESVKGAMKQEQQVFGMIAEARTKYAGAQNIDEKAKAAGEVETAFGRLLVVMENYPQLKSSETVQGLMAQLEGTENRISVERKRFNDLVRSYDTKIKVFPGKFIASLFGFDAREYFEAAEGAKVAPKVSL